MDVKLSRLALVEFPADDPGRALEFWRGLLGVDLDVRTGAEGGGWQTRSEGAQLGLHRRGTGPGDTFSLAYFDVDEMPTALRRVAELGGSVIHPGDRFAVCKDSEGSPFGLMSSGRHEDRSAE